MHVYVLGSYTLFLFFLVNIYMITSHPKSPPHSSNPFLFCFPENFYFRAYFFAFNFVHARGHTGASRGQMRASYPLELKLWMFGSQLMRVLDTQVLSKNTMFLAGELSPPEGFVLFCLFVCLFVTEGRRMETSPPCGFIRC